MICSRRFHIPHPATWLTTVAILYLLAGCAPTAPSGTVMTSLSGDEARLSRARLDLAYLDGSEPEGRKTASRGYTRTAAYLAGQMKQAGLQPVLSGEYRLQYAATLRRALQTSVRFVSADTTVLVQGEDFLFTREPESFQSSGPVSALPDPAWMLWHDELPEEGPEAGRWEMDVAVEERVTTAPMHVLGMIPGAHPVHRDSLVILLAPADGSGLQGEESWTDGSDLAIPAAAVLSVMRRVSEHQQTWALYPQTTMVALVSGSIDGCQGPQRFVDHLPWDRSLVSALIVVTMQGESECDWNNLWSNEASSSSRPDIRVHRAYVPFSEPANAGFGRWQPRSETQRADALDAAMFEAMRLAQEIMAQLP